MIVEKEVYLFMGPPGSGKGSLSKLCVKQFGWDQLSTGNLCREHISRQTEIGKQIDFAIKSGKLISDSLVTEMVDNWLSEILESTRGIILDGFPRTVAQAEAFNDLLVNKFNYVNLKIIKLTVPNDEIVARLAGRYICTNNKCQAVYSLLSGSSLKPKNELACDDCSQKLVRRSDDEEESVRERLKIYYSHERDLLDFYVKKMHRITELNGARQLNVIFEDFKRLIGN